MAVTGDAEGGGPGFGGAVNNSWNTFWDVATARFDLPWIFGVGAAAGFSRRRCAPVRDRSADQGWFVGTNRSTANE